MRPLQWKKIPDMKLPGTIWFGLDDLKWEPLVDLGLVQRRFGTAGTAGGSSESDPHHHTTANTRSINYSFLSTKQSTNLEIALKKIKDVPLKELPKRFLQMDESVFSGSLVDEVMRQEVGEAARQQALAMPTDTQWSTAEAFMVGLFRVPAYELRLAYFKMAAGFEEWSITTRRVPSSPHTTQSNTLEHRGSAHSRTKDH
jgi:hypothetical protein